MKHRNIKILIKTLIVIAALLAPFIIFGILSRLIPDDFEEKNFFNSIVTGLLIFVITKIVESYTYLINKQFKHLSSLNRSIAYLNRLHYSIKYNLMVLGNYESNIKQVIDGQTNTFLINETESLPNFDDHETKFSIINLEIINKLEGLCYFVDDCNRNIVTLRNLYGKLRRCFNEDRVNYSDEQRLQLAKAFIESTVSCTTQELKRLQIDLFALITIMGSRFQKDYEKFDIKMFNLFFDQAKDKISHEEFENQFDTKTKCDFKLTNDQNIKQNVIDSLK